MVIRYLTDLNTLNQVRALNHTTVIMTHLPTAQPGVWTLKCQSKGVITMPPMKAIKSTSSRRSEVESEAEVEDREALEGQEQSAHPYEDCTKGVALIKKAVEGITNGSVRPVDAHVQEGNPVHFVPLQVDEGPEVVDEVFVGAGVERWNSSVNFFDPIESSRGVADMKAS
jgi:hypothetical protein